MGYEDSGRLVVEARLCQQIDALLGSLSRRHLADICAEVDAIRSLAGRYGMQPLSQLARGLELRMAEDHGNGVLRPWLEMMREAAGCGRIDAEAADSFIAAAALRFGQ